MEQGQIAAIGTHAELLERSAAYRDMVALQFEQASVSPTQPELRRSMHVIFSVPVCSAAVSCSHR